MNEIDELKRRGELMIQRLIALLFSITERFLPPLSAKLAAFIFFNPLKRSASNNWPKQLNEIATRRIRLQNLPYYHNPAGDYTLYSVGAGPVVLLVHGWGGNGVQFRAFVKPLLRAGYRVIAFDAFAHGQSSGKRTNLMEFAAIIEDIEKRSGELRAIIGHSVGGMAAAVAVQNGVRTNKLITINTPASIHYIFELFAAQLNVSKRSMASLTRRIETITRTPIHHFSAEKLFANIKTPGLIIHDIEDKEIAVDQAQVMHRSWTNSRLTTTKGLGHRRILHDRKTIYHAINFLGLPVKQANNKAIYAQ